MTTQDNIPSIYFDTCAIPQENGHFHNLLVLSKQGLARVYISEVVIWERIRSADGFIMKGNVPLSVNPKILINAYHFKNKLQQNGVEILEHTQDIINIANGFLLNKEAKFNVSISNELRDAHIIAVALDKLEAGAIFCSNDRPMRSRLSELTKSKKFRPCQEAEIPDLIKIVNTINESCSYKSPHDIDKKELKSVFSSLFVSILPSIDPDNYQKLADEMRSLDDEDAGSIINIVVEDNSINTRPKDITSNYGALDEVLNELQPKDKEIRSKILGYTGWYDSGKGASKTELYNSMIKLNYDVEEIQAHATILKRSGFIQETQNYWLANRQSEKTGKVFDDAMALVMPEILEMMGLS